MHVADAARVRVAPFARATANITLAPTPLRTVTGTVTGAAGRPVPGGLLMLGRGDGLFGLFSGAIQIRPDGSFAVAGLQPGTYYLHFRESAWPPPRGVAPDISGATVVVRDADIANVRVVPVPMVRGTGRVVIDAAARSSLRASEITVGGSPIDFSGNPGPQLPGAVQGGSHVRIPDVAERRTTSGQWLAEHMDGQGDSRERRRCDGQADRLRRRQRCRGNRDRADWRAALTVATESAIGRSPRASPPRSGGPSPGSSDARWCGGIVIASLA